MDVLLRRHVPKASRTYRYRYRLYESKDNPYRADLYTSIPVELYLTLQRYAFMLRCAKPGGCLLGIAGR